MQKGNYLAIGLFILKLVLLSSLSDSCVCNVLLLTLFSTFYLISNLCSFEFLDWTYKMQNLPCEVTTTAPKWVLSHILHIKYVFKKCYTSDRQRTTNSKKNVWMAEPHHYYYWNCIAINARSKQNFHVKVMSCIRKRRINISVNFPSYIFFIFINAQYHQDQEQINHLLKKKLE